MLRMIARSDISELQHINATSLGYVLPLEQIEEQLTKLLNDPDHHYLIGYEENTTKKLVGYVHAEIYTTLYSPELFNVLAVAVDEDFQKIGVGKKILQALEKETIRRNLAGIRLNSGSTRKNAHQFYEHMGYLSKDQKRFIKLFSPTDFR